MGVFITHLKKILKDDIVVCASTNDHVHIEEEKNNSSSNENILKKITIKDFKNKDRILIRADKGTELPASKNSKKNYCLSPLIKSDGTCPHNRVCDCVIVHEGTDNNAKVLLIELKSTDTSGAATQIKNTKCFIEYLQCIAKSYYGINVNLTYKGIIFHTDTPTRIKKRTTRPSLPEKPNSTWDNPAKRVVSNEQEISIKELLW